MQPHSTVSIRDGQREDAASVAAILRDTGWFEHLNSETAADTAARVTAALGPALANDQNALLVAEDTGGRAVGYLFAHWLPNALLGSEVYISELFVRSSARCEQGAGTALLAAITQRARQRGCSRLMLFNRKERESYRRRFYHNQGWVERDDTAMLMYYLD